MRYRIERTYKKKVCNKKETDSLFKVYEFINDNHRTGDLKNVKYILTILEESKGG